MNHISLMGRLVEDPEIRTFKEKYLIAKFTLAVARERKKDVTDFIPVQAWGEGTVNFLQKYAKKGARLAVSGDLQMQTWESEGKKHRNYIVNASGVELVDWPERGEREEAKSENKGFEPFGYDDNIPF